MSVSFKTIKAGDKLWNVKRNTQPRRMGSRWSCWPVLVQSIDHEAGTAMVSWNGNPARLWTARSFASNSIRRSKPEDPS